MKIIECVPNFSDGTNTELFKHFETAIRNLNGVQLLNLEPNKDYNRVVVTLAGDEAGILEGALALSRIAAKNIDMKVQKGEHPRLGAIDVVPFIPVKNCTMQDCIEVSKKYGKLAAEELNVPVYLYEESASVPERKNLANVRKGEYEGLKEKLSTPGWEPDFGTSEFNPELGGIITGARFFLIAYNVNIASTDLFFAKEIAEILRESGRVLRDASGNVIKVDGVTQKQAGKLKTVKAMGVTLEEYNITQVSMNLTNYTVNGLYEAFEAVKEEAAKIGATVQGSEIVGLTPLDALLKCSDKLSLPASLTEEEKVNAVIEYLGLNAVTPFNPSEKIIDYKIK